jgi:DNA-binding transcriptional ArsR family regulator
MKDRLGEGNRTPAASTGCGRGRGLLLVPCAFAWPDVIVRTADPQPTVTYSPHGLGLDATAPTLSVHLKALRAAGIVTARRDGRSVLYHRTDLGDHLIRGTGT